MFSAVMPPLGRSILTPPGVAPLGRRGSYWSDSFHHSRVVMHKHIESSRLPAVRTHHPPPTVYKTPRCNSPSLWHHTRSRAPIALINIAYSYASLGPEVPFFLFFFSFSFFDETEQLCVFICSSRWCQNSVFLHGYDHVHLDLNYLGIHYRKH
jgi:hypothetical protein